MFNRYYQSELTYLREMGQQFAREYPDLATTFEDRGGDPDVERLLEGFAFLTARIRERQDDAIQELSDPLSQLLLPQFARQVPAASVVEFQLGQQALRQRQHVPGGTELGTKPIRGTACLFRTTRDVDLVPLTIAHARLDTSASRSPQLTLACQVLGDGVNAIFAPGGFELFLHGQLPHTSQLLLWFARHVSGLEYRSADGYVRRLDERELRFPGIEEDASLVPWPARAPTGTQLLQTYLNLAEAMLFVRLPGLQQVEPEHRGPSFELTFRFAAPPALPERLTAAQFRPNCVPVVNLFSADAAPIKRDPLVQDYLLRADGLDPMHVEVYSIDRVSATRTQRRDKVTYNAFHALSHPSEAGAQDFYQVVRRTSLIDQGLDTYLTLSSPRDAPPVVHEETLSAELTCTNRQLVTELQVGDICVPTRRSPTVARFRNIVSVSAPALPPLGSELQWRMIAHIAINYASLSDPATLRSLLSLYNFRGHDHQLGRANQARLEGIRDVQVKVGAELIDGVPVRGALIRVSMDQARFAGPGEAFLLGCVLDALYGAQASVNSFCQLTSVLHPSGLEMLWPAKNGQQALV